MILLEMSLIQNIEGPISNAYIYVDVRFRAVLVVVLSLYDIVHYTMHSLVCVGSENAKESALGTLQVTFFT